VRTTDKRRGMSLAEVLIACFLLLLFMGACVMLFTRALRTFRQGDERTVLLNQARLSGYRLTKAVRECSDIIQPLSSEIAHAGTSYQTNFIVLLGAPGCRGYFANYRYNRENQTIERLLYNPSPEFDNPSLWVLMDTSVMARNIETLTFTWEDRTPPQDYLAIAGSPTDTLAPQMVKITIKTLDNREQPGSGMLIWTKVRMRR
jgi:hypothetical protein